ncbi:MAG: dihydroorotate dehydrogenase 2, nonfunctional [Candidatus Roizmanbacteria bacterium GW2011_GWA2_35_19]|nr:MAG: dihydroorotate dehydrogenase 2, nonfunctional [Candidatus Roizmanbacteria bacterium GW2011_GWA2_35_19]
MKLIGSKFIYKDKSLKQKVSGITFENPVGLAAGFDYNANLTQALSYLNFGFQSVGTITYIPYEGNPPPRLGRLPKSRSLMVNKGFKNLGTDFISKKLKNLEFKIPIGISIGLTNSNENKTLDQAIKDIVAAFKIFENSGVKNSYYELNISCPNLINNSISFYKSANLKQLLQLIKRLKLKKSVFIKMPIEKSNAQVISICNVLINSKFIKGVIIGNLQKDRKHPSLVKSEVKKFKVGYFSGKACEERSNELIKLVYKKYKSKLIIIGCGGVFSGADAYKKIKLGATLIQLITGMIFQGPQLIAQINLELIDLLKKDGFENIKEAVGGDVSA